MAMPLSLLFSIEMQECVSVLDKNSCMGVFVLLSKMCFLVSKFLWVVYKFGLHIDCVFEEECKVVCDTAVLC